MAADDGRHDCPYPNCGQRLPRSKLACRPHWYIVSPETRARVNATWRAYAGGRGSLDAYLTARQDAVDEMAAHAAKPR